MVCIDSNNRMNFVYVREDVSIRSRGLLIFLISPLQGGSNEVYIETFRNPLELTCIREKKSIQKYLVWG